jgi:DNA polymerase I-like protein with 3'-5' exonuclease and polymerase domains
MNDQLTNEFDAGAQLLSGLESGANSWTRIDALPDLRGHKLVALDTETKDEGIQAEQGSGWATKRGCICGISAAWREGNEVRSFYAPIAHPGSDNFPKERVFAWLRDLFASSTRLIFHNSGYDLGWMQTDAGIVVPPAARIEDTGALATMIDENRLDGYSLDALCRWRGIPGKDEALLREAIDALLGVKTGKRRNPPQSFIWQLPAHRVGPYAEQDAISTLLLHENLDALLDEEKTREAYRLEVEMVPLAIEMRRRGIRVDAARAECNYDLLLQKRDTELAQLSDKLGRLVAVDEIKSNDWLAKTCDQLGIPYPCTEAGKPSFTGPPLGWMHRSKHWFPPLVVRIKKFDTAAHKFLGLYVLDHVVNGRIHAEIHPHRSDDGGTRSTRFSYRNPPLQQMASHDLEIAQPIRDVFCSEEGEFWGSFDYSQQELRLIVHYAVENDLPGAQEAAEQYRNDPATDFHAMVAEKTGLERPRAKAANFGIIYGIGADKFSAMLGCSKSEAIAIMQRHARDLPFMALLSRTCMDAVARKGFVELYDGARRHFNLWEAKGVAWGKDSGPCDIETARARTRNPEHPWFAQRLQRMKGHAALNALIQGSAARQTKIWMRNLYREGIVPMLTMHDAVEVSVKSQEEAERIAELGREAVPLRVPMLIDVKFGRSWGGAKHKWNEIPEPEPEPAAQLKYRYDPKGLETEKPAPEPKPRPKKKLAEKGPITAEQTKPEHESVPKATPQPARTKPPRRPNPARPKPSFHQIDLARATPPPIMHKLRAGPRWSQTRLKTRN